MCKVTCDHWLHSTSELVILWKKCYTHATKLRSKKLPTKFMHSYVLQILGNLFLVFLISGGNFRITLLQACGAFVHRLLEPSFTARAAGKIAAWLLTWGPSCAGPAKEGLEAFPAQILSALHCYSSGQYKEVVLSRPSSPRTVTNNSPSCNESKLVFWYCGHTVNNFLLDLCL